MSWYALLLAYTFSRSLSLYLSVHSSQLSSPLLWHTFHTYSFSLFIFFFFFFILFSFSFLNALAAQFRAKCNGVFVCTKYVLIFWHASWAFHLVWLLSARKWDFSVFSILDDYNFSNATRKWLIFSESYLTLLDISIFFIYFFPFASCAMSPTPGIFDSANVIESRCQSWCGHAGIFSPKICTCHFFFGLL